MKIGSVYTHILYIYVYTHVIKQLLHKLLNYFNVFSPVYIQALEGKSLPAGKTCLPECHN